MDATKIHPTFQTALGIFNGLRCLGFEPEQIFFAYSPQGMVVDVNHDGRGFGIRAGAMDMTREKWAEEWGKVASAVHDGTMTQESLDAVWQRFYPFRMKLIEDLRRGGVRIPNPPPVLGTT